ncbi:glycosyltransferase family 2 protein [Cytobacillus massiliigabonensis]|uniref:glycosyltransferase family 2 protein n=1 Tax=Cytobacillus massiliigabonensis TaxID=1871011 RepID=UPI000C8271CD|nr:glycosyltransferase family 2 protein [Cytobacillus massiliigabonensis]
MKENNKERYPLVSILIPTYNRPHYFELALTSALQQTYPNIEILVGDDSSNDDTENLLLSKYLPAHSNITFVRNPRTLGSLDNNLSLFEKANGRYINYLMDDDLFYPEKIEKMMAYFLNDHNEEISLVTSHRNLINEYGLPLPDGQLNQKISKTDAIASGIEIGNQILMNCHNYIGEPTTPLFRKQDLKEPFGTLRGRRYHFSVDMASWILLLSKGNIAYISEPLSCFRLHRDQQLQSYMKQVEGIEDLTHLVVNAKQYGFLQQREEWEQALIEVLNWINKGFLYYRKDKTEITNRLLQCQELVQTELSFL